MLMIMSHEGADPKILGHFFKAVVHDVLLLRAETWVLIPRVKRALFRF